jgi:UDP-glucuronate decarboxylase
MHPNDGRVVSNFVVQALKGKDITIYGTGKQTRSFCYVDDLVEGMLKMMATKPGFTGPVNLGNPVEQTVAELAETVVRLVGSSSKVVYSDLPADDPKQRKPDISKARAELGWEPTLLVEEGLKRTIAYFDKLLSEEPSRSEVRTQ